MYVCVCVCMCVIYGVCGCVGVCRGVKTLIRISEGAQRFHRWSISYSNILDMCMILGPTH